jgi:hypothetical protein
MTKSHEFRLIIFQTHSQDIDEEKGFCEQDKAEDMIKTLQSSINQEKRVEQVANVES